MKSLFRTSPKSACDWTDIMVRSVQIAFVWKYLNLFCPPHRQTPSIIIDLPAMRVAATGQGLSTVAQPTIADGSDGDGQDEVLGLQCRRSEILPFDEAQ